MITKLDVKHCCKKPMRLVSAEFVNKGSELWFHKCIFQCNVCGDIIIDRQGKNVEWLER